MNGMLINHQKEISPDLMDQASPPIVQIIKRISAYGLDRGYLEVEQ
jgi:hypothetical protein